MDSNASQSNETIAFHSQIIQKICSGSRQSRRKDLLLRMHNRIGSWKLLPLAIGIALTPASLHANPLQANANPELPRLQHEAANVTIVRDDWGIAHVTGKTDADSVFGMIYAQAKDDFNRVETNYLNSLGRLAETEGESKIYQDLRQKLFIDPVELQTLYAKSPRWLQELMNAWADGLNFYLANHPDVKPRVIHHFEPWMALSFTEGSIGGDIERVDLQKLEDFYGKGDHTGTAVDPEDLSDDAKTRLASGVPRRSRSRARWIERHRHRPLQHRRPPCAPAHQSAHLILLPLRTADDQQPGPRRLRSRHLGTILHLSGIQRPRRVDAHLQRRRRRRRISRNRQPSKRQMVLQIRCGRASADPKQITVLTTAPTGMASKTFTVYYTTHGPIIRAEKWEVGRDQAHAETHRGPRTVPPPHQGKELCGILQNDGDAGQLLQQHRLCRCRR